MNGNDNSKPTYPGDPADDEYRERCILLARLGRTLRLLENHSLEVFVDTIEMEVPRLNNFPL